MSWNSTLCGRDSNDVYGSDGGNHGYGLSALSLTKWYTVRTRALQTRIRLGTKLLISHILSSLHPAAARRSSISIFQDFFSSTTRPAVAFPICSLLLIHYIPCPPSRKNVSSSTIKYSILSPSPLDKYLRLLSFFTRHIRQSSLPLQRP